jgi:hypothetical protein
MVVGTGRVVVVRPLDMVAGVTWIEVVVSPCL